MTALPRMRRRGVDADRLRACMRLFPTGVAMLTAGRGDGVIGMTVNSVISVSLEPPLMLVSVHQRARITAALAEGTRFTLGILNGQQTALSRRFAAATRPVGAAAVAAMCGRVGAGGVPAPADCLAVLECVTEQLIPVGDHLLVIGLVVHGEVGAADRPPQVFFRGALTALTEVGQTRKDTER